MCCLPTLYIISLPFQKVARLLRSLVLRSERTREEKVISNLSFDVYYYYYHLFAGLLREDPLFFFCRIWLINEIVRSLVA